jgi:hypothetical protein
VTDSDVIQHGGGDGPRWRPRLGAVTIRVTVIAVCCALLGAVLSVRDDDSRGSGRPGGRSFSSFPDYELDLLRYAQVEITARCLTNAGFPQLVNIAMPPPSKTTKHLTADLAIFGPTSDTYARTYGFGPGPNGDWQPPMTVSRNGPFDKALSRCDQRAWRTIGTDAQPIHTTYKALSATMISEYGDLMTETIKAENLNVHLLDCLTDRGYTVLDSATFLSYPFPGHFGIRTGGPVGGDQTWWPASRRSQYIPTSEEADFAVIFAHCNRTTGRLRRLLARSRQAQDLIMRKHEAEMAALNAELTPLASRAMALAGST